MQAKEKRGKKKKKSEKKKNKEQNKAGLNKGKTLFAPSEWERDSPATQGSKQHHPRLGF